MPKLVCVTGPDGSGKTTQIARIAERLERRAKKKVVAVTIWDLLLDPATRNKIPFKSPQEVDAYLEVVHPTARGLFLYHCLYQALELSNRRNPDVCLLNAYWYKYYATEVAHGGDPERLRHVAEIFPEPAITFYLRIDPEAALARKAQLSGYETGFGRTKEAFLTFQAKAHEVLDRLAREKKWIELNGREPIDTLTESIVTRL